MQVPSNNSSFPDNLSSLQENRRNSVDILVGQKEIEISEEQQPQLLLSIHKAIEQERQRIAEDLHDSVAQDVVLALHKLEYIHHLLEQSQLYQAFQEVTHATRILENGLDDLRGSIDALLPRQFDKQVAFSSLITLIQEYQQDHPELQLTCQIEPGDLLTQLPTWLEMPMFRFVQQALNNIWQHASAKHAMLSLVLTPGTLVVEVTDDGNGFSPRSVSTTQEDISSSHNNETPTQFGLRIMRERVERVGGTWEIKGQPGSGTSVRASFLVKESV